MPRYAWSELAEKFEWEGSLHECIVCGITSDEVPPSLYDAWREAEKLVSRLNAISAEVEAKVEEALEEQEGLFNEDEDWLEPWDFDDEDDDEDESF
jgi:hypothetical protein